MTHATLADRPHPWLAAALAGGAAFGGLRLVYAQTSLEAAKFDMVCVAEKARAAHSALAASAPPPCRADYTKKDRKTCIPLSLAKYVEARERLAVSGKGEMACRLYTPTGATVVTWHELAGAQVERWCRAWAGRPGDCIVEVAPTAAAR